MCVGVGVGVGVVRWYYMWGKISCGVYFGRNVGLGCCDLCCSSVACEVDAVNGGLLRCYAATTLRLLESK
jgi:hypothetical protein